MFDNASVFAAAADFALDSAMRVVTKAAAAPSDPRSSRRVQGLSGLFHELVEKEGCLVCE